MSCGKAGDEQPPDNGIAATAFRRGWVANVCDDSRLEPWQVHQICGIVWWRTNPGCLPSARLDRQGKCRFLPGFQGYLMAEVRPFFSANFE